MKSDSLCLESFQRYGMLKSMQLFWPTLYLLTITFVMSKVLKITFFFVLVQIKFSVYLAITAKHKQFICYFFINNGGC